MHQLARKIQHIIPKILQASDPTSFISSPFSEIQTEKGSVFTRKSMRVLVFQTGSRIKLE
jgi:hypothetical protein